MKLLTAAALSLGTLLVGGAASAQGYYHGGGYGGGYNRGYNRGGYVPQATYYRPAAQPVYYNNGYAPRAMPVYVRPAEGGWGWRGGEWHHHWRRGW
jgi:hypothetical protein